MRRVKEARCTLLLCADAGKLVKAAGFELRGCSLTSEACYYGYPGKTELLRIAAHRNSGRNPGIPGKVVSRLTFAGNILHGEHLTRTTDEKMEQMTARAIGYYFLRSA